MKSQIELTKDEFELKLESALIFCCYTDQDVKDLYSVFKEKNLLDEFFDDVLDTVEDKVGREIQSVEEFAKELKEI